jgi:hypothetical protein
MGIRCQSEILQDSCGTASGRSGPRLERALAIKSVCNHELKSQTPGKRLFYYKSTMSRIIAKTTGDDGLRRPASPAKSCDLSRFRVPCHSGCSFHVLRDQQHHTCGERISSCTCPLIALDLTWLLFLHNHLAGLHLLPWSIKPYLDHWRRSAPMPSIIMDSFSLHSHALSASTRRQLY